MQVPGSDNAGPGSDILRPELMLEEKETIIMATPPKYFGGWRDWTADSAAQNLRNVFWEHPVIETSSGVVVVA